MTIIQNLTKVFKKTNFFSIWKSNKQLTFNINIYIIFTSIVLISIIFFSISNILNKKNYNIEQNLKDVTESSEFSNLTNYIFSKINSPYEESRYSIKNNDSIEKILKKFNVRDEDIKKISLNLKRKKLFKIYSGRELKIITKQLEEGSRTVVSLDFPVNNTTSIEVRKSQDNYIVYENILQLYKKEVVIRGAINNNLYNAAIKSGIEPNIIIEFARVFGFEVDFQRDIRKGDWFEIFYEKFEDYNEKVRDTGKIIYASM